MSPDAIAAVALFAALPPAVSWFWWNVFTLMGLPRAGLFGFMAGWLISAAGGIVIAAIQLKWSPLAGCAISAAIALLVRWWRGNGRRAAAALGAKSRARLAALADRAREASRPSPVRRPALGGAR